MKKITLITMLIINSLIYAASPCFHANIELKNAESKYASAEQQVTFPVALRHVMDEAFAGTGIQIATFGDQLVSVGNQAFFNSNLHDVYIPRNTHFFGEDAFPTKTVIHGVKESDAETWALKNSYRFVYDDIWNNKAPAETANDLFLIICLLTAIPFYDKRVFILRRYLNHFFISMRPQDRPELYPINYRFP